jgi:4-hydroxybenzoate polyprenyltransferase
MVAGLLMALLAGLRWEDGGFVLRWRSLVVASFLVIAIFLYDGAFKATWAGPILMGLCRFLNILLGLSIYGGATPGWGWLLALIIGIYIAGVTWFARSEARASNQGILIAAAIVMLVSLVLALAVPAVVLQNSADPRFPSQPSFWFLYLLAIFGGFLGVGVLRAIQRPDPARVQTAVKRAILGLVVLDALLASAFIGTLGLLLAFLLIPGIILGRWLYST